MYQVVESAEELLSIRVQARQAYLFKQRVISRYNSLHEELKQHILKSPVLCIDEGDVTLRKTKGYVWVFTTHDAVWYLYKDTRSGEFLKELLAGIPVCWFPTSTMRMTGSTVLSRNACSTCCAM